MKLTNKLSLIVVSVCSVFCVSNSSITSVLAESDTSVSSVKDAINKLINAKNYTLEVSTKAGPIDITYHMYYTEDGFYDDYLGDEYGYAAVEEGVFYFDLYNRNFTASNLLKDAEGNKLTSVWDESLVYGLNKLRTNEFETATGKTFTSAEKRVKNVFLNMFHVDFGKYQYVKPVEFTVGNDINTLQIDFSLTTGEYFTAKVKNYGKTKIDVIDNYLDKGSSYHQDDSVLTKIIDLFSNYNYTRIIYDSDVNDYSTIAGYEMYAENYFYTFFEDQYILEGYGYEIGMVSIDKVYGPYEANDKTYGPYTFHGSYYCFISEDESGEETLSVMTSFPINSDPFVPNVYNYPTFLKMFSDTQYLDKTGGSANQFYTSKLSCVTDFVSNFQMSDSLNNIGAVPIGVYVEYYPNGSEKYAGTLNKETVVFSLEVSYYGAVTSIDFAYTDFNNTKIDCITQENVDQIIENAIQSIIDRDAESTGD